MQSYRDKMVSGQIELRTTYKKSYALHLSFVSDARETHSIDDCPPLPVFFIIL